MLRRPEYVQEAPFVVRGKASPSIDPRELFAAEVEALLRSIPSVREVKRAPEDFALQPITTTGAPRVFLDNAFAETREMSPQQRRERIAFFFGHVGDDEQDEAWEAARETFVPALRGSTYGIEIFAGQPKATFVRKAFLPYLDIVVAMDRRTSMSFVSRATIARWHIEEADVFEAAAARVDLLENLLSSSTTTSSAPSGPLRRTIPTNHRGSSFPAGSIPSAGRSMGTDRDHPGARHAHGGRRWSPGNGRAAPRESGA